MIKLNPYATIQVCDSNNELRLISVANIVSYSKCIEQKENSKVETHTKILIRDIDKSTESTDFVDTMFVIESVRDISKDIHYSEGRILTEDEFQYYPNEIRFLACTCPLDDTNTEGLTDDEIELIDDDFANHLDQLGCPCRSINEDDILRRSGEDERLIIYKQIPNKGE